MIAAESCRASGFCLPSGRPISYICQKQSVFSDGFYDQKQISFIFHQFIRANLKIKSKEVSPWKKNEWNRKPRGKRGTGIGRFRPGMKGTEGSLNFHCKDPKDIHSEILAERVRELKETQEGVEYMCKEMDKIYSEGEQRGEERGEMKKAKEMALSLAEMGIPVEKIAQAAKVSAQVVEEWLSGKVNIAK